MYVITSCQLFDWTRTDLAYDLPDGSNALIFDEEVAKKMDPVKGELSLPGWDSSYTKDEMKAIMDEYSKVDRRKTLGTFRIFH